MRKETIEVHPDAELKRRIEEAAARQNVPVEEYCLDAIEQKLQEDDMTPSLQKLDETFWEELRELRESILARRGGKPLDIDILELVRSERDDELTGMR